MTTSQTPNLAMPYLLPQQAQKHVVVNETFSLLDSIVQMAVEGVEQVTPPILPTPGKGYLLARTPSGDWQNQGNKIAFYQYNAWVFLVPQEGWRIWDKSRAIMLVYKNGIWEIFQSVPNGLELKTTDIDHQITAGSSNTTSLIIPRSSVVLGITGVVTTELGDSQTWQIGVEGYEDRYGNHIGYQENSTVSGLTSYPLAYYADTAVKITPVSENFSTGAIRLRLYTYMLAIPTI